MNLSGKKVIVVGTGISGIGAVKLLCEVGAQAVLYDGNDKLDKAEIFLLYTYPSPRDGLLFRMPSFS